MSLSQQCLGLVRKYGSAARVVVTGVLNVVAPGSGTLIELASNAIEATAEVVEQHAQERREQQLLDRLGRNEEELTRLGQMLEYLAGPLSGVCDKGFAFVDQPDDLPDIIGRAIAADPALSQILHQVNDLKEQLDSFQASMKELADRQQEAIPVYMRMNRVADYFDELWESRPGGSKWTRRAIWIISFWNFAPSRPWRLLCVGSGGGRPRASLLTAA